MSMSKPGTGPMMASGVVPLMHRDGGQAGRGSEGVSLTFHPASAAQHITLPPSLPLVAPGQLAQVAQARQKPFVHRHGRGERGDPSSFGEGRGARNSAMCFVPHHGYGALQATPRTSNTTTTSSPMSRASTRRRGLGLQASSWRRAWHRACRRRDIDPCAFTQLKLDPHRDAICADKNPAQVVGERFGISEWTVYRHYKRACTDGLIVPADTKFRKSKAATMEATRDTVLSKDAAKQGPGCHATAMRRASHAVVPPSHGALPCPARRKRRPEAEMTLGSGPWTVSVFHIQGAQLDGFSFYCEFWRESGNTFNMWCTLPGVRSSDDLQVTLERPGDVGRGA